MKKVTHTKTPHQLLKKIVAFETAKYFPLQGIEKFAGETTLLTGIARIHEELMDMNNTVKMYKEVLHFDNTYVEAIACIATNHFYTDQPEVALRFYRYSLI